MKCVVGLENSAFNLLEMPFGPEAEEAGNTGDMCANSILNVDAFA
jgi:hypothetical protein